MEKQTQPAGMSPTDFIKGEIRKKAMEKNGQLGVKYYSENPDEYDFIGNSQFEDHFLMIFRCSRSYSSLTIRINRRQTSNP